MAMELLHKYNLNVANYGTYISKADLLSTTGKHRFVCAMCYNTTRCSKNHIIGSDIRWDTSLFDKIYKLVSGMDKCSGITISSGYRSPGVGGHDKCVGGGGKGPHTLGQAIDICFHSTDGGNLNCRQIAVLCEQLNLFNGNAPISEPPRNAYIHLDTKGRKWYGDEHYMGYTGCINNGANRDFLSYYANKGLPGFNSLATVYASLGWNGATDVKIPEQTGSDIDEVIDSIFVPDYVITAKPAVSYNKSPYYPIYTGSSSVLRYALEELSEPCSNNMLLSIAYTNGIVGYTATLQEDASLMSKLRQGKLIRP